MSISGSPATLSYFETLQQTLIGAVHGMDGSATQRTDRWQRPGGGGGLTHVFADGALIEKGGINFSHVKGESLPESATQTRPALAHQPFEAMGVSVVLHPRNPFIPTTHMNVRFFSTRPSDAPATWWFGGGFDLTPYYPFEEDAVSWHLAAYHACEPFGQHLYARFKAACDAYFFLPHRNETRGVGGLFFDDFNELGEEGSLAFTQSVGNAFFPAWAAIVQKRAHTPYDKRHRAFQAVRRGRYVEFNLLYDRGTLFGLQSRGRTESILMSLPPRAEWQYDVSPEPDSPEAGLQDFLRPRNWLTLPSSHE
jgi:coproporphyrinogen III oxidase